MGKVGDSVDFDTAVDAARLTGLQLLAVLRRELGRWTASAKSSRRWAW